MSVAPTPLELEGPFIGKFSRAEVKTYPGPGDEVAGTVALYTLATCPPWLMSLDRYRKSVAQGRILSMAEYDALLYAEFRATRPNF